jgi:nicotinamide-nucleotide amidase
MNEQALHAVHAEVLAVGDEILYGDIINGNAAWLGNQLSEAGVRMTRSAVCPDDEPAIAAAVTEALGRAHILILTGGLGPTQDDLTREGLARAAGAELVRDPGLESDLRRRFSELNRNVPERNYQQADLPVGATALPNTRGTAPGVRFPMLGGVAYALPGVPHEMYDMFTDSVLPELVGHGSVIVHRILRTAGMWESAVAEALALQVEELRGNGGNPAIAFLASGGQTRVKITAQGPDRASAATLIAPVEAAALAALGTGVYGRDNDTLEGVVLATLRERGATLAVAESLTGGLLAGRLTDVPGASSVLLGGIVSYATAAKEDLLGVPAETLAAHGAVSDETVIAMAEGVRDRFGATMGLATSGVAGPDLQEGKPVGTLHVGVAGPDGSFARSLRLPGQRPQIRASAVVSALDVLRRALINAHTGS